MGHAVQSLDRSDNGESSAEGYSLIEATRKQLDNGFAPPAEAYLVQNRHKIDWSQFPEWARPSDPEMFDGCGHEG